MHLLPGAVYQAGLAVHGDLAKGEGRVLLLRGAGGARAAQVGAHACH